MSSLLMPRHVAVQMNRKDMAAATAIAGAKRPVTNLESDEFASAKAINDQLAMLREHVAAQRELNPGYHLPRPSGWRLAVLVLTTPEKSDGGVVLPGAERDARALVSPQGVILATGPAAYSDPRRFSLEGELVPWHKVGDRIMFIKYDAPLYKLANGQQIGFLTDTQPIALLDSGWEVQL